MEENNSEHST